MTRGLKTTRRAVDAALAEWRSRGHLAGAENAGRRAILRELAHAADVAAACEAQGTASNFSRSRVLAELAAKLDQYAPPPAPAVDPRSADLESRALAIIEGIDAGDIGAAAN